MSKHVLTAALLLSACTDESATRRTLEASGFTDVTVGGYAWFSCSEGDNFATSFSATNSQGKRVHGAVCCGLWKNCTVRF